MLFGMLSFRYVDCDSNQEINAYGQDFSFGCESYERRYLKPYWFR